MHTQMLQRAGRIGTALALATILGCQPSDVAPTGTEATDDALSAMNGLPDINGLSAYNGLNTYNGLNVFNGLSSYNGLASYNGLMTTADGRQTVTYLVRCALAAGDSLVKQDQYGNNYTFAGGIGLATQYKNGACDVNCQEAISSCMLAHINTSGTHIPLWLVGPDTAIGWGQSPWYPTREGTFFGNIFNPDSSGQIRAHYCQAPTTANNTVPGRLGASQNGAPYTNPYQYSELDAGYCETSCQMNGTDGPGSCPADGRTWSHPITVWRGQTFQAETSTLFGRAAAIACTTGACSNGYRVGLIDPTSGVTFNYVHSAAGGTQSMVVYYANGDLTDGNHRAFNISVNGGSPQNFAFPVVQYGNWNKVAGMTVALTGFLQGGNNTVRFVADGTHPAPDLDWIEIMPGTALTFEAETGFRTGQAAVWSGCATCSAGARVATFGPNSSVTIGKINVSSGATHTVVVYYTNGDAGARSMYVKVNGNPAVLFSNTFKSTGNWTNVGSATLTLTGFVAGSNTNTITFSTDATFAAPDLDFIQVN